jgi:hypothetical protein
MPPFCLIKRPGTIRVPSLLKVIFRIDLFPPCPCWCGRTAIPGALRVRSLNPGTPSSFAIIVRIFPVLFFLLSTEIRGKRYEAHKKNVIAVQVVISLCRRREVLQM